MSSAHRMTRSPGAGDGLGLRVGSHLSGALPLRRWLPEKTQAYAPLTVELQSQHSPGHPPPSATRPVRERPTLYWWFLEIFSCSAAAACLAALATVLLVYDGRPQDSWPSSVLTLNGLVALLATLCRTFFMVSVAAALAQEKWNEISRRYQDSYCQLRDFALFDEAARGPMGSVQLLWRFKGFG